MTAGCNDPPPLVGEGNHAQHGGGVSVQELTIFVDADACPVKAEIYRVAERFGAQVKIVSNAYFRVPTETWIEQIVVTDSFDAADKWIIDRAHARSVVVTSDIPLAHACLQNKAIVLAPTGKAYNESSIGMKMAVRNIMSDLRASGDIVGGPKPFTQKDRSAFLSALDTALTKLKKVG
jgi:uncharacterized protein